MRPKHQQQASSADRPTPWRRLFQHATSLQFKATVLVVILTLAVTTVVAGYLLRQGGQLVREQHQAQLTNAAGVLAKAVAVTLAKDDLPALNSLLTQAASGTPLLYVIVSDVEGRQLAVAEDRRLRVLERLQRDEREKAPVPGRPGVVAGTDQAPIFLDITYPITIVPDEEDFDEAPGVTLVGYLRTGMMANQWERSMASRLDLLIGVGLLAAAAAIPLGFLVIRRIIAPLDGLADAMVRCSQGHLDVRSPVRRRDEIGRLAEAFNRMADQHQRTHERIVRLNAELEERVNYRTQQLRELASRDPLTGLYNRRYFNEVLERRFAEAVRYEGDLACIMVDLDDFKAANDAFGHQVGDDLLVLGAATIISQLRSADVAARYGGDEYIVLLPQTDEDRARILAERIFQKFARDVAQRFPKVPVTMSVGVSSLRALVDSDAEALIRAADHALYEAKSAGKKRIFVAGDTRKSTAT
jgi:diguanylate cyclase (GGDEF)-like protein